MPWGKKNRHGETWMGIDPEILTIVRATDRAGNQNQRTWLHGFPGLCALYPVSWGVLVKRNYQKGGQKMATEV